jgi:uncharacterized membrane protein
VGVATTLLGLGILGLVLGFVQTVRDYRLLPAMDGVVLVLGVPVGVFTMTFAVITSVVAVAVLRDRWSPREESRRNYPLGFALVGFGAVGWCAAYALAADKVQLSVDPTAELNCNVSLLVQCGANLGSWQGSVFGFPNPLIGLAGWAAVITVGCLVLAGIRVPQWFWIAFNIGVSGALAFVVWLIGQSIFVLGTLCPWCMVTWAATIPVFWAVTLRNAKDGRFGVVVKRTIGPAYSWIPLITLLSYIAVAVIAQLRLDVISYL